MMRREIYHNNKYFIWFSSLKGCMEILWNTLVLLTAYMEIKSKVVNAQVKHVGTSVMVL